MINSFEILLVLYEDFLDFTPVYTWAYFQPLLFAQRAIVFLIQNLIMQESSIQKEWESIILTL